MERSVLRDSTRKLNFAQLVDCIKDPKTGFKVEDRTWRARAYRQCFVASQAVAWFIINCEGVETEAEAVEIGQMLVDKGVFCHVVDRLKPFSNAYLFFRFTSVHAPQVPIVEDLLKNNDKMDALVNKFVSDMEGQLAERKVGLKTYRNCFTGSAAVDCVLLIAAQLTSEGKLRREEGVAVLQCMMDMFLFIQISKSEMHSFSDNAEKYFQFSDPRIYRVASLRRRLGLKRVGQINAKLGYRVKHPLILIPGVISSALDVWYSEEKPEWTQQRIWLSMSKIGLKFRNGGDREEILSFSGFSTTESEELSRRDAVRDWVKHITPREDGWSDPPGIKVRAHAGFEGIDYMADNFLKKASFIFGKLISNLIDVGYEPKSMVAAPYDWRLPPSKLQERDKFFTWLKIQCELLVRVNGEKVVLISHSMGCRTVSYFLEWVKTNVQNGEQWLDNHIHAWMALGAPLLGAPVTMRSMMIGDTLGLDLFLHSHEGVQLARHLGSLPWLFPLKEEVLPDHIVHVRSETGECNSLATFDAMQSYAPRTNRFWNDYYANDPLFIKQKPINPLAVNPPDADLPPVLRIPSVKNTWIIYGTNIQTESSYFFRPTTSKTADSVILELDTSAGGPGSAYDPVWNPNGLKVEGGVAYETEMTAQPAFGGRCVSGDGTVPYASLAFAHRWKELADFGRQNGFNTSNVEVSEVKGAQHRLMLNNDAVLDLVIKYVCHPPEGIFA